MQLYQASINRLNLRLQFDNEDIKSKRSDWSTKKGRVSPAHGIVQLDCKRTINCLGNPRPPENPHIVAEDSYFGDPWQGVALI